MSREPPPVRTRARRGAVLSWARLRRWLVPAIGVLALGLLLSRAGQIDWAGSWHALRRTPPWVLLAAWALATLSHALYGCFDLLGRGHARHAVARWRTWAIAVASYAFNLNLGSLVGGVALRARLYARAGLDETTVAQIVGLSLATNWLGYGLLAGGRDHQRAHVLAAHQRRRLAHRGLLVDAHHFAPADGFDVHALSSGRRNAAGASSSTSRPAAACPMSNDAARRRVRRGHCGCASRRFIARYLSCAVSCNCAGWRSATSCRPRTYCGRPSA